MKKNLKKLLVVMLSLTMAITSVAFCPPIQAQAKVTYENSSDSKSSTKKKSERYFSDVSKSYEYRAQIEWLAKKGAYKGIAKKGKKFKPEAVLTRKQLGMILDNLYGDRINITIKDPKKKVTQKYATKMLTSVSKQLGYTVTWSGGAPKAQVTRAKFSYYLRSMIKYDKKLEPTS